MDKTEEDFIKRFQRVTAPAFDPAVRARHVHQLKEMAAALPFRDERTYRGLLRLSELFGRGMVAMNELANRVKRGSERDRT